MCQWQQPVVYPHQHVVLHELAGGPRNGHHYCRYQWGQDVWYLKEWYDAHPEARPLYAEIHSVINLERFDIQGGKPSGADPPKIGSVSPDTRATRQARPTAGRHPMSAVPLNDQNASTTTSCICSQSTGWVLDHIYHITPRADRVRQKRAASAATRSQIRGGQPIMEYLRKCPFEHRESADSRSS